MRTATAARRAAGAALAAALTAALPGRLPAQGYPTTPPAPTALRPVRFPPFVNARMASGLDLLVVAKRDQPVVTISLSLPAGGFYEPADRAGLASMVATLLTKGTAERTADQIAAEVEGLGGSIGAGADDDFIFITISGLSENTERLFAILAEVVRNAGFPEAELELARTQALSGLRAQLAQPAFLAGRQFGREVYGAHPYGRWTTPETIRAITREDVVRFAAERLRPQGSLLVVAGDVNGAAVRQMAQRAFGGWTGAPAAAPAAPAVTAPARTEIVLVNKPGAVQSNIVAGFPFITPRDPDVYALTVMNRVLGGGADARLFMILREQKGWTYGAYSSFSRPRGLGAFQATAEVRTEVTDSALGELLRQLDRIRTEAPADSEITAARNYLVGRFPLTIETADEIAGRVANARRLGLPDDYVLRYRERLSAVTRAQIAAAARRRLTTDRMVIVVVGDGRRILPGLQALGMPVRIVSTEGVAMTAADLAAPTGSVRLDGGRITAGTYQYRVMVQGNAFGTETRTIERTQDGGRDVWRVVTATRIGPVVNQDDTTVVDARTLAPIRVRQTTVQQGQNLFVRLDYADGRVRGAARTVTREGPRDITVDTAVAAGVYDDNSQALLMSAVPLAAGTRAALPLFSGGKGRVETSSLSVVGEESVTTPGGTFACWKVEVSGGEVPLTMYVAREAPHHIVKIELTGVPLVFEFTGRN